MYQEGRSFGLGRLIVKFLLIVALIVAIVAFFPTKGYVKNLIDNKLNVSQKHVFNNNIQMMQSAAYSYYSGDRLPNKSNQMTLNEMIRKHLITDLTDSNGKTCNVSKSYVKVTNMNSEYQLEVYLVCTDKQSKIISYFNSNNKTCNTGFEKKKLNDDSKEVNNKGNDNNIQKSEKKDGKSQDNTAFDCKYVKTNYSGYYTNWSNWTVNEISSSKTRQVQSKVVTEKAGSIEQREGNRIITQNPKKVSGVINGQPFTVYVCPSDFDNGGKYKVAIKCRKTVPNFVTKPTYKNVTYYRYRDYKNTSSNIYKWSRCNDDNLINQGFKFTGEKK